MELDKFHTDTHRKWVVSNKLVPRNVSKRKGSHLSSSVPERSSETPHEGGRPVNANEEIEEVMYRTVVK